MAFVLSVHTNRSKRWVHYKSSNVKCKHKQHGNGGTETWWERTSHHWFITERNHSLIHSPRQDLLENIQAEISITRTWSSSHIQINQSSRATTFMRNPNSTLHYYNLNTHTHTHPYIFKLSANISTLKIKRSTPSLWLTCLRQLRVLHFWAIICISPIKKQRACRQTPHLSFLLTLSAAAHWALFYYYHVIIIFFLFLLLHFLQK